MSVSIQPVLALPDDPTHHSPISWLEQPRKKGFLGALGMVLLAGLGDHLTGADIAFTLFYLVPIAYATWRTSRRAGLLLALLSALLGLGMTLLSGAYRVHAAVAVWNTLMQVSVYVAFAWLLDLLRERMDVERQGRRIAVEQLRHAERLTTVGKLAAGLAHELGTPLNVISGRAELLQSGRLPADELPRSLQIILEQTHRMSGILRQLLDFARRGGAGKADVDAGELVAHTSEMLKPMASRRTITLQTELPAEPVRVHANASEMQQVLTNLIVNAIQASPSRSRIRLVVSRVREAPSPEIEIVVEDQGSGIAPEHLTSIFDPFFTTKPVGEGTGLGLSVSYGIVRDHGGRIEVDSAPGRGTRFRIVLAALAGDGPAQ